MENIVQTDNYKADISFYVEQSRNNPDFTCGEVDVAPKTGYLKLENETINPDGPWTIIEDETYAELNWVDGPTFLYTLTAQGLPASTQYSLIYYADSYPGNNPGAFIGTHTTDSNGKILAGSGNPELDMDMPTLPDGNYAVGAKIWLVLTSDYNDGNLSTGPMTIWQPAKYLLEGNVYIHYDDTDITP